jgi:hypothetical protein
MDDWSDDATVPSFGPHALQPLGKVAATVYPIGSSGPTDYRAAPGAEFIETPPDCQNMGCSSSTGLNYIDSRPILCAWLR